LTDSVVAVPESKPAIPAESQNAAVSQTSDSAVSKQFDFLENPKPSVETNNNIPEVCSLHKEGKKLVASK